MEGNKKFNNCLKQLIFSLPAANNKLKLSFSSRPSQLKLLAGVVVKRSDKQKQGKIKPSNCI